MFFKKKEKSEEKASLDMIDLEYRLLLSYIEEDDFAGVNTAKQRVQSAVQQHRAQYGTNDWLDSL
jgi:hypothetical protein